MTRFQALLMTIPKCVVLYKPQRLTGNSPMPQERRGEREIIECDTEVTSKR